MATTCTDESLDSMDENSSSGKPQALDISREIRHEEELQLKPSFVQGELLHVSPAVQEMTSDVKVPRLLTIRPLRYQLDHLPSLNAKLLSRVRKTAPQVSKTRVL